MRGQGSGVSIQKSPNYNERDPAVALRYIVLHYTGMKTAEEWIAAVLDPKVELSAHYLVKEDGSVISLVDEARRAWHAGKSFWRGAVDMNSASIGIEIENPGHVYGYRPFKPAQIEAVKKLVWGIVERNNFDAAQCLVAHSDIAPTRKQDPGEFFPWQELAREGLGFWPEIFECDEGTFDEQKATALLKQIGYECSNDETVKASLTAFCRRFFPEGLNKNPDSKMMAWLRATARSVASAG